MPSRTERPPRFIISTLSQNGWEMPPPPPRTGEEGDPGARDSDTEPSSCLRRGREVAWEAAHWEPGMWPSGNGPQTHTRDVAHQA